MAIIPVDPLKADALSKALDASTREAYAVLTFDWDRNNTFGSAYADMSEVVTELLTDRSYSANLPDGLNVVSGFASGELQATLGGSRPVDNVPVALLFDPYTGSSPLATYEILGTPVNLVWRVRTALGDVDTQGFRGFIRSFQINRAQGTVQIVAADNLDIAGADVELPRWAAATTSPISATWRQYPYSNNNVGSALPINSRWAIEETLRQSGRSLTRAPRSDALFYTTLRGSSLPNIGSIANVYQLGSSPIAASGQGVSYYTVSDGSKIPSFTSAESRPQMHGTVRQVDSRYACKPFNPNNDQFVAAYVPQNGTAETPVDIGTSFLWYPETAPTPTPANYSFRSYFYLEDYRAGELPFGDFTFVVEDPEYNSGRCQVEIQDDRKLTLTVRENTASGYNRIWTWTFTLPTAPTEPLEIYAKFRFSNNSITAELRLDGVVQTLTPGGSNPSGVGYRYRPVNEYTEWWKNGGKPRLFRPNAVWLYMYDFNFGTGGEYHSSSDVEWFGGYNGVTYQARPKLGTLPNGKPTFVYHGNSLATRIPSGPQGMLYNMPQVESRDGWNLLAEILAGESGLLWTDEYGTLHIANASYHQTPVVSVADHTLSDDQIMDLILNPSDDNRRNRVITPVSFKGSSIGFVWAQPGARDRYIAAGSAPPPERVEMPTDAVMYNTRLIRDSEVPPTDSTTDSVESGHISVVKYNDVNTGSTDYSAEVYPTPGDTRSFRISSWAGPSVVDLLFGSYKGANQPNLRVSGVLEGAETTSVSAVSDSTSVAAIGRRSVNLPANPWTQSKYIAAATGAALLGSLVNPAPLVENVVVPADPRRQVFDTVKIPNETGFSGVIYAQILSKVTRYNAGEFTDTLTLRILNNPGTALWDSGIWDTDSWAS